MAIIDAHLLDSIAVADTLWKLVEHPQLLVILTAMGLLSWLAQRFPQLATRGRVLSVLTLVVVVLGYTATSDKKIQVAEEQPSTGWGISHDNGAVGDSRCNMVVNSRNGIGHDHGAQGDSDHDVVIQDPNLSHEQMLEMFQALMNSPACKDLKKKS
jgi:hypothetical protein